MRTRTSVRRGLFAAGLVGLALTSAVHFAHRADAHAVPIGVGTTTALEISPRRIVVKFNLGFSSLLALGEMNQADTNKDKVIQPSEAEAYLVVLEKKVVPQLRLFLDGKRLELHPVKHWQQGMLGQIDRVMFETYFDLAADVDLGTAAHDLVYHDGSYEDGQDAQQRIFLATDHLTDFENLDAHAKTALSVQTVQGAYFYDGTRDLTVKLAYRRGAIERDRATALLEPAIAGIQRTLLEASVSVVNAASSDLSPLAGGAVKLTVPEVSSGGPQSGVVVSGVGQSGTTPDYVLKIGAGGNDANLESQKMLKEMQVPFSVATLLLFVGWGALHAKGPGHGKTMVAAYLLGTKGRVWDAVRLGLIVTFTHTCTLYTLGLSLVYLIERLKLSGAQQQSVADRSIFLISLFSGLGLCVYGVGLALARRRSAIAAQAKDLAGATHAHGDHTHAHGDHSHAHGDHSHAHEPAPAAPVELKAPAVGKRLSLVAPAAVPEPVVAAPAAVHSHGGHTHSHDGHSHSHDEHDHALLSDEAHAALHAREANTEITSLKDLLSLGISSGIVPCPAGVLLIVASMSAKDHNTWKCFVYLNAFSLGLGGMLVAIAVGMVLTRSYLVGRVSGEGWKKAARWVPVFSALFISLVGLGIAADAFDPGYVKTWARVKRTFSSSSGT